MNYIPTRITLGAKQGVTEGVMVVLGAIADRDGRDPREVAGTLLVERLQELGYLDSEEVKLCASCEAE